MNRLEKLAAKKKLIDRLVDKILDKTGTLYGRKYLRPVLKAGVIGLGGVAGVAGGMGALALADPGGKVSDLHHRISKKYPQYVKRAD